MWLICLFWVSHYQNVNCKCCSSLHLQVEAGRERAPVPRHPTCSQRGKNVWSALPAAAREVTGRVTSLGTPLPSRSPRGDSELAWWWTRLWKRGARNGLPSLEVLAGQKKEERERCSSGRIWKPLAPLWDTNPTQPPNRAVSEKVAANTRSPKQIKTPKGVSKLQLTERHSNMFSSPLSIISCCLPRFVQKLAAFVRWCLSAGGLSMKVFPKYRDWGQ